MNALPPWATFCIAWAIWMAVIPRPIGLAADPPKPTTDIPQAPEAGRIEPEWLGFVAKDRYLIARYSVGEGGAMMVAWDTATLAKSAEWKVAAPGFFTPPGPLCAYDSHNKTLLYLDDGLPKSRSIEGWKSVELPRLSDEPIKMRRFSRRSIWFSEKTKLIHLLFDDGGSLELRQWTGDRNAPKQAFEMRYGPRLDCAELDETGVTLAIAHVDDKAKDAFRLDVIDVARKETVSSTRLKVQARCMAFSPDGKSVIVGFANGTLVVYECATGKQSHSIPTGANRSIWAVVCRGPLVAYATNDRPPQVNVRVYDLARKKHVLTDVAGDKAPPEVIAISGDAKRIATLGGDGTIRMWKIEEMEVSPK